jgi:hypothetical protein
MVRGRAILYLFPSPQLYPHQNLSLLPFLKDVIQDVKSESGLIVDRLRKLKPEIEFSSDFIVGFPGETEKDFEETMKLLEKVK